MCDNGRGRTGLGVVQIGERACDTAVGSSGIRSPELDVEGISGSESGHRYWEYGYAVRAAGCRDDHASKLEVRRRVSRCGKCGCGKKRDDCESRVNHSTKPRVNRIA